MTTKNNQKKRCFSNLNDKQDFALKSPLNNNRYRQISDVINSQYDY